MNETFFLFVFFIKMAVNKKFVLEDDYSTQWRDSPHQFQQFLDYCASVVNQQGINLEDVKELMQVPPLPVSHTQLSILPQGPMGMGVSSFFFCFLI
jgi:hypothetical protein